MNMKNRYETRNPLGDTVRVPFNPEPLETLKARFPAALEKTIDVTNVPDPPPSGNPAHVFDFEDGIRLIVSRDKHPAHPAEIHMSASVFFDPDRWRPTGYLTAAVKHFSELYGKPAHQKTLIFSPKHVPHWFFEEPS